MAGRRILCVDDEPAVLDGLRRNLRRDFDVATAVGGSEGLAALQQSDFEVVVSDYQMPEMSGAEFLRRVRQGWPEATRVLLTGNADLDAAIATVNEGQIYRFLLKPCPKDVLIPALVAAVEHHRLVVAERVLLRETLHGTVRLLVDALSLMSPETFGRCRIVAERAGRVAADLDLAEPWKVEMATMLAQATLVTLPPKTLATLYEGGGLDADERQMIERLPEVGKKLLSPLPRIEDVVSLVEGQGPPWGADGRPPSDQPLGSAILRACIDLDLVVSHGVPFAAAVHTLKQREGIYPSRVLECLETHGPQDEEFREISTREIRAGMLLVDPIETADGRLLVAAGSALTETMVERVRNFSASTELKDPIRVSFQSAA